MATHLPPPYLTYRRRHLPHLQPPQHAPAHHHPFRAARCHARVPLQSPLPRHRRARLYPTRHTRQLSRGTGPWNIRTHCWLARHRRRIGRTHRRTCRSIHTSRVRGTIHHLNPHHLTPRPRRTSTTRRRHPQHHPALRRRLPGHIPATSPHRKALPSLPPWPRRLPHRHRPPR